MDFLRGLLVIVLILTAVFLILLVLVQRGKGGGLAGALGGMGGQSAFGTKAGDLFTKITVGVAAFWIVLCIIAVKVLGISSPVIQLGTPAAKTAPADSGAPATSTPAEKAPASGGAAAPATGSGAPATSSGAATPAAPATTPAKK